MENIKGIACDSRLIKPGYAYFAISGSQYDGNDFIEEAIKNGAVVIYTDNEEIYHRFTKQCLEMEIPFLEFRLVDNCRTELAHFARDFFLQQPKNIVGITGTNGKTSVSFFYAQMAKGQGFNAAAIGTIGCLLFPYDNDKDGCVNKSIYYSKEDIEYSTTTPEPILLHRILLDLYNDNYTHVALEVTSHALDQDRVAGVNFTATAFTNFTQDHLDYHKKMDEYFASKAKLFAKHAPVGSTVVLNADIPEFQKLLDIAKERSLNVIDYGKNADMLRLLEGDGDQDKGSVYFRILNNDYNLAIKLPLIQQYNLLCAIGLGIATGLDVDRMIDTIARGIVPPPGRLQEVGEYNGAKIFVDYAHTPDALENVLLNLRKDIDLKKDDNNEFNKPRLHVIVGCGGDRDKTKRPIMGKIASRLADVVIVTDDNPRTEDPSVIRSEVLSGCNDSDRRAFDVHEYFGRAEAIECGIKQLMPGDIMIIAGKGHENYQIIGTTKHYFSDIDEVEKHL